MATPSPDAPRPAPRAVFEEVTPEGLGFDANAMARGEPGVPMRFRWRGRTYEVAQVLATRREVSRADAGAGAYVRRHVVTVVTRSGERMELSGARGPRGGRANARWMLRTVLEPEAPPDAPSGGFP